MRMLRAVCSVNRFEHFPPKNSFRAQVGSLRSILNRLIISICGLLAMSACGKVGAPVPPARITERTSDLSAIQRGGKIFLSWPAPPLGAKESSRSYIERADVYRLKEQRDQDPILDPDDYED